jgi:tetratricopeptide (TPR) repeat protein
MSEQFEEIEIEDALAAALQVTDAVKNADGYDELASAIATRYAQRSDFKRAVDIADSINDPFSMEKTIGDIAVMLASAGHEDAAFELIDSIEDFSHKAVAMSQVAVAHANAGEFDRAIEIASGMDDNSSTLVDIAYQCADKGDHDRALDVISELDFPLGAVWVRIRIARDFFKAGRSDDALELLTEALDESNVIDPPNERAGALAELALRFNEFGNGVRSSEIMSQAMENAEEADDLFKDATFSQIAIGFARLKQYDTSVTVTEKIDGVYLATSTLIDLASVEHENEKRQADAVLLLSDAFDLIVEDEPKSQNDESQHNFLLTRIATSYAQFGLADQALKTAHVIGDLDSKHNAFAEVASRFARLGKFDDALIAARSIDDDFYRTGVLTRIARLMIAAEEREKGSEVLSEASRLAETLERPLERAQAAAKLAIAYAEAGEVDRVGNLISDAVGSTRLITDADAKASALVSIADACWITKFELGAESKEVLWEISAV